MKISGLDQADDNSNQTAATTQRSGDSRRLRVQRCIQDLIHAVQCQSSDCSQPLCQKLKRIVQHTEGCRKKTSEGCPICKQLIALCVYHAYHCQENICPVPYCRNMKLKLRRQQRLQHSHEQVDR